MSEPKGCPFCGDTPDVEPWHGGAPTRHLVACVNDGCDATMCQALGETREDAIKAWNTREQTEDALEALRDADMTITDVHDTIALHFPESDWKGSVMQDLSIAHHAIRETLESKS